MSVPNFLTIPFHPRPSLWRLGIIVESESCSSPWNIACFSGTVCRIRLQIFCSRRKEVVLSSSQRDTGGTDSWQPLRSQFQKIYWGQTPWGSDHFPRRKRVQWIQLEPQGLAWRGPWIQLGREIRFQQGAAATAVASPSSEGGSGIWA